MSQSESDTEAPRRTFRLNVAVSTHKFLLFVPFFLLYCTNAVAIKCVCNLEECDNIRPQDCPGKGVTVWDPCHCCKVCAKTLGEACGGPGGFSGSCEPPLQCITKPPVIGTGLCLELPPVTPSPDCKETVIRKSGCEIINRKCRCWRRTRVCKDLHTKWDFRNMEECLLSLENIIKAEMEFDEDYTISPQQFVYMKVRGKRRNRHPRDSSK